MKRYLFITLLLISFSVATHAQFYAVKTNTLSLATCTLNGGVELALNKQWSLDVSGYWNPVKTNNISLKHWYIQPAIRWWLYEHFAGHFAALQVASGKYDIGNSKRHTRGWFSGVGASYGYTWILSKQWNMTAEAGLGFYYTQNKRKDYFVDDWQEEIVKHSRRIVLAPSKIELSLSYLF